MSAIPLNGIPFDRIPIVTTGTKQELFDLLASGQLSEGLAGAQRPNITQLAEAHHTFHGRLWVIARQAGIKRNTRHLLTTHPTQPWWSIPIRPGERAYQFNPDNGEPADGSGRPYPHPVLPPEIADIEAERCGPYRDAFGLCSGCGLRGHIQRRCKADDPDRAPESTRRPRVQPWKWVPCPHGCGYIDTPEVRPSKLYGLFPLLSITR
ncbi:hypothetical protein ACFYWS_20755 [Streptomyces sp. NPDC002795]|uniref:hypothetical protein n=1 Tax=Streptomyces sp. NPDC002795 TaxID=3364665 RepID=UPI0036A5FD32